MIYLLISIKLGNPSTFNTLPYQETNFYFHIVFKFQGLRFTIKVGLTVGNLALFRAPFTVFVFSSFVISAKSRKFCFTLFYYITRETLAGVLLKIIKAHSWQDSKSIFFTAKPQTCVRFHTFFIFYCCASLYSLFEEYTILWLAKNNIKTWQVWKSINSPTFTWSGSFSFNLRLEVVLNKRVQKCCRLKGRMVAAFYQFILKVEFCCSIALQNV